MARASKLKVYRTAAGFHDAYVAAPSQKAALAAWGSDHDLFARGIADLVTDPDLAAEPLASPGTVIKRSRGTTAEQIAAMPARAVPAATKRASDAREEDPEPRRTRAKVAAPAPPKPKPKPKPSRRALDVAEEARDTCESGFRRTLKDLADREAALVRERRALERSRDTAMAKAQDAVDAEKQRYDDAIADWKG